MTLLDIVKEGKIRNELRNGNTAVLKGLEPSQALAFGLAMQREYGVHESPSMIDNELVTNALQERLKESHELKAHALKMAKEQK